MHGHVSQQYEYTTKHTQSDTVGPQRLRVETKRAEDSRTRDFNVEAILVVDKRQVFDFVDNETFKGVMED